MLTKSICQGRLILWVPGWSSIVNDLDANKMSGFVGLVGQ